MEGFKSTYIADDIFFEMNDDEKSYGLVTSRTGNKPFVDHINLQ